MNCTKTDCPAAQQCPKVQYRGSICAALRDEHGLGDPLTFADKIRAMTDEELAQWLADCAYWISQYEGKAHPLLKMLQKEVSDNVW